MARNFMLSAVLVLFLVTLASAWPFKEEVLDSANVWEFRNENGKIANIKLLPGGRIGNYDHPNEHTWAWEGGNLVFKNVNGKVSCKFVNTWLDGKNKWRADGLFLLHKLNGWRHYLIQ